ncbi:MAG: hypothetical protein CVT80_01485 [Alphaproteobacteria bacterium HGW-Alphaproteobacteria-2]|nr:MAG: hypothetical protein CVT80_01485 [Alphaproteobacteria bacterium HGW-Alphaproteobacteria-2]
MASRADTELRRLQDEHEETFKKADRLIQVLSEHIRRDAPEFDELVAVAKTNLAAQRTHQEDLRSAKTRVDDLTRDRTKRTEKLAVIEADASNARRDWVERVAAALPKGLDAGLLEASLQPLCEVFFGTYPIVVEGDTEHAAFMAAVVEAGHELIDQVTIIKARGKPQIRAIMKMLIHFRKDFGVLHDCDWPYGKDGRRNTDGSLAKSGSWAHNAEIRKLVNEAKRVDIGVAHEVSIPDFERRIGLPRGTGGKPFEAYLAIKQDEAAKAEVQALLVRLKEPGRYADVAAPECDAAAFVTDLLDQLRKRAAEHGWEDSLRLGE